MTQHKKIIEYIKRNGFITISKIQERQIFGGLGINNGSARMSELDRKYHFQKDRIDYTAEDGTKNHYYEYRFSPESYKVLEKEAG